jgi:hypothetical protein
LNTLTDVEEGTVIEILVEGTIRIEIETMIGIMIEIEKGIEIETVTVIEIMTEIEIETETEEAEEGVVMIKIEIENMVEADMDVDVTVLLIILNFVSLLLDYHKAAPGRILKIILGKLERYVSLTLEEVTEMDVNMVLLNLSI